MSKSKFDPFDAPEVEAAPNGELSLPEPIDFEFPSTLGGPGRHPSAVQSHYDGVIAQLGIGDSKALPVQSEDEAKRYRTVIQTAAKKVGMTARCAVVEHDGQLLLGFRLTERQARAPMTDEQREARAAKSRATREANKTTSQETQPSDEFAYSS